MEQITLTLTVEEVNSILSVLGDLPTKSNAWPLTQKIYGQAVEQLPKPEPVADESAESAMNYLALTNRLRVECGTSNTELSSVIGANDEAARLAAWIAQAWQEIQTAEPEWQWMRGSFSFPTVNTQYAYTSTEAGIASFTNWKLDSMRVYETASGFGTELLLSVLDYDSYRNKYLYSSFRTNYQRPLECSVAPDKTLVLGPVPTAGYTVVGEYYKAPTTLSLDADVPDMPERFHMAIVYLAMTYYGLYEAAPEVLQRGQVGYMNQLNRLRLDQLPMVTLGSTMA